MILKILSWCLCALVVFSLGTPAYATPISREMAVSYFKNCQNNPDPRFSEETQKMFCACTASQMTKAFTVEDMQAIGDPSSPRARTATNKMMINVYAPCIQYPAQDYHYQSCIDNPKSAMLGNPENLCSCAAGKVSGYLKQNAANKLRSILRNNPNIADPMQAIYEDAEFQQFAQSQLMGCVGK